MKRTIDFKSTDVKSDVKSNDVKPKNQPAVYRILVLALMILVLLIAGGSLFAILRPSNADPLFKLGNADTSSPGNSYAQATAETSVFNGIGRLRIPVAGRSGASATMILSIAFPYPAVDQPFTEELASKIVNFRTITSDYFSSLPASTFVDFNEENAKAELINRYNDILRLGKIQVLYFSDLMILE